MRRHPRKVLKKRFLEKVRKDKKTGCWLWTGARDSAGYGEMWTGTGMPEKAHRVAWWLYRGRLPVGKGNGSICRRWDRCQNKHCVNPAHLHRTSNISANSAEYGRLELRDPDTYARGEQIASSILKEKDVRRIRRRYRRGVPGRGAKAVAKHLDLPVGTVKNICFGRTWKHVA